MNLFGNPYLRVLRQAIRDGDLTGASRVVRHAGLPDSAAVERTTRRLVDLLVERAGRLSAAGNLSAAWDDLAGAAEICPVSCRDDLAHRQTRLIETTIGIAEANLQHGQPVSAARAVELLRRRKIPDRRADAIHSICQWIRDSEALAAAGRWMDALQLLERAQEARPELAFVASRIRVTRRNHHAVEELTSKLRHEITESHWSGADELSRRILQIAPNHQIALDARTRCQSNDSGQGSRRTSRDVLVIRDEAPAEARSRADLNESATNAGNETRTGSTWGPATRRSATHLSPGEIASLNPDIPMADRSFEPRPWRSLMLWIDGVGGFLVCTAPSVLLGRAAASPEIDIALQADIRRRHARINRAGSTYLIEPLDAVSLDDQVIGEPTILRGGQTIELGQGVLVRFELPHPLGCTARLEFPSRHRTEPWSDAVLLLGDALLIGPSAGHHIRAPRLKGEWILFRRGGELLMRVPGVFEIDGETAEGDVALRDGSRLEGERISITVEQVLRG